MIYNGGYDDNLNRNVKDDVIGAGDQHIGALGMSKGGRMVGNCVEFNKPQHGLPCISNNGVMCGNLDGFAVPPNAEVLGPDVSSVSAGKCDGCGGNVNLCICDSIKDQRVKPKIKSEPREIYRDMLRSLTRCWYPNYFFFFFLFFHAN